MGSHRSGGVAPQGRGKHRAPTNTGRNIARVAAAGVVLTTPVTLAAGTASASGFDRNAIIECESGGDARAQNSSSSASGLYQFIDSTWKAYGGSTARAKDASVSEQHRVAQRLFAAEGYSPWNASKQCWSGKLGSGSSVSIQNGDDAPKESAPRAEKRVAPKAVAKSEMKVAPKKSTAKHKVAKSAGTHTVVSGDTLSEIALKYTGAGTWQELHAENRDVVGSDPHAIVPGQVLDVKVGK